MKRKLRLCINGMFYGDRYTRLMLWSVFLVSVFCIGSLLTTLALHSLPALVIAGILAIVDGVLLHRMQLDVETYGEENTADLETEKNERSLKNEKSKKDEKPQKKQQPEKEAVSGFKDKTENAPKTDRKKEEEARTSASFPCETEKELKRVFYKYKVKRNHRPVMIDSCKKYKIWQCPAYAWVHRGQVHLLLMEKEVRKISLPLAQMKKMGYERSVIADSQREYGSMRQSSLLAYVFREYVPTYYSIIRNNEQKEAKNLYVLGPDMKFTNTSVRELRNLFDPEFVVSDPVMDSDDFNIYFKRLYKQHILLRDGVITAKEYQMKSKEILQQLVHAVMTPAAVRMTLTDMVAHRLISNEYASYYSQMISQQHRRDTAGKRTNTSRRPDR